MNEPFIHQLADAHSKSIGTTTVTNGDELLSVHKSHSTDIPIGTKHQSENLGNESLHIVEIQVGDYLGEDDIQRYEDNYDRRPQANTRLMKKWRS